MYSKYMYIQLRFQITYCNRKRNLPYVIYRIVLALYVLFWNVYAYVTIPRLGHHYTIVFLTNWTYIMLAAYLSLAAVNCTLHAVRHSKQQPLENEQVKLEVSSSPSRRTAIEAMPSDENCRQINHVEAAALVNGENIDAVAMATGSVPLSYPLRLQWLLFTIATNSTILICLVYYAFLFPVMLQYMPQMARSPLDINLHAGSVAIVIVDLLISRTPVRLAHALYPLLYGTVYIVFSVLYWACDREWNVLYEYILDWNHPLQSVGYSVACLSAIPVIQILLFVIFTVKRCITNRCKRTRRR